MTDTTDPVGRAHILIARQLVRMSAAYEKWAAGSQEAAQEYAEALGELLDTATHIGELLIEASEFAARLEADRG